MAVDQLGVPAESVCKEEKDLVRCRLGKPDLQSESPQKGGPYGQGRQANDYPPPHLITQELCED